MCLFFVPQNKRTFLMLQSLPRKMVHLPSLRSRMTGRYLLPFCKTLLRVCSHLFSLFHVYSHLPLPTANAATFPDKRGRLTFPILSFCNKTSGDSFFVIAISSFFCVFSYIYLFFRFNSQFTLPTT